MSPLLRDALLVALAVATLYTGLAVYGLPIVAVRCYRARRAETDLLGETALVIEATVALRPLLQTEAAW